MASADGTVERRVVVSGRVQGVAFRWATESFARRAGAKGYVRNLADGSVEAVVQGTQATVSLVVDFMRSGPPGARVTNIVVEERPTGERFDGFEIRD